MTGRRRPNPDPEKVRKELAELDQIARTRTMRAVERPKTSRRLITEREHRVELVITGITMFAAGFLACAIALAVFR